MVLDKLKVLIAELAGIDPADISDEMDFLDDIGLDSLDIVELIMSVEEAFDIEIPDEDAYQVKTVLDAAEYIRKRIE